MANVRFGFIEHPSGATFVRFGDIAYSALAARMVVVAEAPSYPGDSATVSLGGTWDAADKTMTIGGVSVTLTSQNATSVTFTTPTPYADGSSASALPIETALTLSVTDGTGTESDGFTISAPDTDGPTYWYIPSIEGSPWAYESSIFYGSSGLSNGDSAFLEVTAGGPLLQLNSDGSWVSQNPIEFRVKGFNASGWSAAWAEFAFRASPPLAFTSAIGSHQVIKDAPVVIGTSANFAGANAYALTGTLPAGMAFDTATGSISGAPTAVETATGLKVTATDGLDTVDSDTFSIAVVSSAVDQGSIEGPVKKGIRNPIKRSWI